MALKADAQGRTGVRGLRGRLFGAIGLIAAVFVVLLWRLYGLQVLRGEELSTRGVRNFVQYSRIPHDRGIIYDRYGRILVDNRPSLDAQIIPAFLGDAQQRAKTLATLAEILSLSAERFAGVKQQLAEVRGLASFKPILVKRDLEPAEVEAVEAQRSLFALDGVKIVEGRRRTYPYGTLGSHLLGYVNEIDAARLARERERGNPLNYELGDVIGRAGVERTFEAELRGRDGYEKVVVDAKGRRQRSAFVSELLGEERRVEPTPGHNVYLTIDRDLQQVAQKAFQRKGKAGAVVALDPNSGAILAWVSAPEYDPNLVSGALAQKEKAKLDNDPLTPWLNRPIQGQYAPGSTFKAITGAAGLAERAVDHEEEILCPGYFRMGNHTWRCHKESGHGQVRLRSALKVSCDTYFYTVGARVGINAIAQMARQFGFGAQTGIALRHEKPGLVPDEAYHDRVTPGGYQRGMAVNTAIGQGAVLVTPLQLAVAYAAIANGGTIYKPRFVDRIETADFRVTRRFFPKRQRMYSEAERQNVEQLETRMEPSGVLSTVRGQPPMVLQAFGDEVRKNVDLSSELMAKIRAGLEAVTSEPGGTGYWRRSREVSMAGKTGTSQVVRLREVRRSLEEMPFFERDHAWFAAYAPVEDPQIVVAVINEHSGHGGSKAEPVAVDVIDAYFSLQDKRRLQARAPPAKADGDAEVATP